ncbi:UNKNOWN [Stylonychia lemnae]|uniref:Uncharacterized protein n=1 Tax=Stylonychia lemnae TaxID=5949 RepID=A0A078AWP7_STYLE|nr:UNKNOWN [Stylonychia lemnae]|eukprot:CDW85233.1 UNKNOWN [Stylonychia lemnae]
MFVVAIFLIFTGIGLLVTAKQNPHSNESAIMNKFVNEWNNNSHDYFSSLTMTLNQQETKVYLPLNIKNDMPYDFKEETLQYLPAYFLNTDIRQFLMGLTSLQKVKNPLNENEYNLTASFQLNIINQNNDTASSVHIQDIVLMRKYKTLRMMKDCNINHMGQWNSQEQKCYGFSQIQSLCLIMDQDQNLQQPVDGYQNFMCDGRYPSYINYMAMDWREPGSDPGVNQFKTKVSFLVRSNQDPIYKLYTTDEIKYEASSLSLLIGGICVLAFGLLLLSAPILAFFNHKERRNSYRYDDNLGKMYRI